MKLKYKINLVSLSILTAVTCAIAAVGFGAINQISYDLNQKLMSKEVDNIVSSVRAAHKVLKDSGVSGVESYLRKAQHDLLEEFRGYRFGETGRIMVVEHANTVLLYDPIRLGETIKPELMAEMIRKGKGTLEYPCGDRMGFFCFDTYPEWNWLVVLSVATDEMFEARNRFLTTTVLIFLGSLILGGFLFLWFTNRIVKPIRQLATAAECLSRGEWDAPLPASKGKDEIAQLSAAFQEMSAKLAALYLDLQENFEKIKRSQGELARLATAIEQAAEGIIVLDADWSIEYVNPAFERMTGYGRSEIIGRSALIEHREHEGFSCAQMRETLSRGEIWSARMTNKRKDGTSYEVEATGSPVRDDSGVIINYVAIHRDITHEVRLERELRQSQKMEAVGRLAGGIAHDFNNILAAIMGFAEMAQLRIPEGSQARRDIERVVNASSRAADLVGRILTYSRKAEPERKPVSIAPVVEEALRLLRSSLPSTIVIREDILLNPGFGTVLADSTQIHQVLINLCTNAAHAMRDEGGVLSVQLSEVESDVSFYSRYPDLKPGPYVELSVSDTGCGMDAALIDRIFDPYFTTKRLGEGTGMGLAVVQGIVKSHGGAISVHSEPGRGSSFILLFPGIEEKIDQGAGQPEELPAGTERILFVDDEENLTDLAEAMLTALGYSVTTKTSSIEALETFRAQPEAFDLVITDMTMPGLTGKDFARRLMDIRRDVPVILCTGFSEFINERQAIEAGIREFVTKPYSLITFAKAIRKALEQG
ncbi:MAG: PAS domain S-box protein [Syntrophobacteraceae bacterium]